MYQFSLSHTDYWNDVIVTGLLNQLVHGRKQKPINSFLYTIGL